MKLIHVADLHLGTPFSNLNSELKKKKQYELQIAFETVVNYALKNDIKVIMLAGDVFDKNVVAKKDQQYFYGVIKNNPSIDFLYLKGNHDFSFNINEVKDIQNLKLFDETWITYKYEDVTISGIELNESNSSSLYSSLALNPSDFNIIMMHGEVKPSITNPRIDIVINNFKDKFIDYIALGHIHEESINKLDNRCTYAYSGCLKGRGFDETGKKGFIEVDTTNKEYKFIPLEQNEVYVKEIDLTNTSSLLEAINEVKSNISSILKDSMLQVIPVGRVDYDFTYLKTKLEDEFKDSFSYFEVKMKLKKKINYLDYKDDISLKGQLVREVLSSNLSNEEKEDIIDTSLTLLEGGDIDLCD